ncbi:MAG: TetR/AcrR family transcriptional regulator [Bacillota bacterium]
MEKNETKREIIEAAMNLFASNGYYETTMSDIVEASATSKGTLYYYFDNKLELFETMINDVIGRIYEQYLEITGLDIDVREKLRRMLTVHAEFYKKNYELAYTIFMEGQKIDIDCKQELWKWKEKFNKIVGDVLVEGIDSGVLKNRDVSLMTHSFLGLTNSFGPAMIEDDYEVDLLVNYTLELFLEGVGA